MRQCGREYLYTLLAGIYVVLVRSLPLTLWLYMVDVVDVVAPVFAPFRSRLAEAVVHNHERQLIDQFPSISNQRYTASW